MALLPKINDALPPCPQTTDGDGDDLIPYCGPSSRASSSISTAPSSSSTAITICPAISDHHQHPGAGERRSTTDDRRRRRTLSQRQSCAEDENDDGDDEDPSLANEWSRFPREYIAPSPLNVLISFLGPAIVFLILGASSAYSGVNMLNGSFGAAVVVNFSLIGTSATVPKTIFLGQSIGTLVGLSFSELMFATDSIAWRWIWTAASVSTTTAIMKILGVSYPPGGATAFTILQSEQFLGIRYLLFPILVGSATLVTVSWIVFRLLKPEERYPVKWI